MARLARIVAPGDAHFVVQRGNRGQQVFFSAEDSAYYRSLVAENCNAAGTECWAYCLLPDQIQLILVPHDEDGLRAALGETHRRYARRINRREGWTGYFWQGRFASFPMEDRHIVDAVRYIERNPVRAGLCADPEHWRWSSARAHLEGRDDALVSVAPLLQHVGTWRPFLASDPSAGVRKAIESHSRTGRPLGSKAFIADLEARLGRRLARRKPGPKPKVRARQVGA